MMAVDQWKPTSSTSKYGVAICNFRVPENLLRGLQLNIGETVQILEECSDWYKGRLLKDLTSKGIFPKRYIKLKDATVTNEGQFEVITPVIEPVIDEVTSVLREWGGILKDLFLEKKLETFHILKDTMLLLMDHRRDIIFEKLTKDQQKEVREKITDKIDSLNRVLNLDLIPRIDGEIIEGDSTSVVELFQVHTESSKKRRSKNKKIIGSSVTPGTPTIDKRMSMYGTLNRRPQVVKTPTSYNLFMSFKSFMCNIGDTATLLFSLYDAKSSTYITEKYVVKLTKHGMPVEIELLGKQHVIFQDLKTSDIVKSVYLVCKIFREGKLVDSKKHGNAEYRRPFGTGAGVVDLSELVSKDHEDEEELNIPIYNCSEIDFHMIEDYIIRRQSGKYNTFGSNSNFGVCVGLKLCDVDKIMTEKGECALCPSLGFPEVILPGYIRNDFYVTLCKAEFERGSKSSGKNIEVALCVVSNKGQIFNDCMSIGCGVKQMSEYRSYVVYHANSPQWNEQIKVCLPIEQFHTAHLRFTFSHCSRNEGKVKGERIFGFSFIKLLKPDGTVTKNGFYELFIYKFDNSVDFAKVNTYLRLPANNFQFQAQKESGVVFEGPNRNPKEMFQIRTNLCSTRLTQNSDIVNLLQWRNRDQKEVFLALDCLLKVSPEEIVKFLQDIFDALFKILSEMESNLSLSVFRAMVAITVIVEEPKYEPFKSTLSSYIEEHFSATLAYRSLAENLCYVLKNFEDTKLKRTLSYTVKSLVYIFKMIVRSCQLHFSASQNIEIMSEIKEMVDQIFESLTKVCSSTGDFDLKIEILKRLKDICEDVLEVYSVKDYSIRIQTIINAIPENANAQVQTQKLQCLRNVVESNLFVRKEGRTVLMEVVVKQLSIFMKKKSELGACLDLLGDVVNALQHLDDVYDDVSLLSKSLLMTVLNVLLSIDRRSNTTGLSVACLLGILKIMEKGHYQQYIEMFENKVELRDFMKKLTVAFKELLTVEIFPKDWFVFRTVGNNIILTAVQYFSKAFTDYFLTDEYFEQTLWDNYFQLSVLFLVHPSLHLESFQVSKRVKILERYGDMRRVMGIEILGMWEVLDSKKKHFIPSLIGSFLEMTLVPDMELRKSTIPIFYDMMKVEFSENHNFKKVEAELIEKLELLMNKNKGDLEYQQLFEEIMVNKFKECPDPQFHDEGLQSICSITELLKRLLDYRSALNGDSSNDVKMMCTFNLLEFYKTFSRKDMYIKCIYKLVELHKLCNNHAEAGFTLLLHAEMLEFSDKDVDEFLHFSRQPEWQRKEQLYLQIIEYFDNGKMWESGIIFCKALATLYENKIVDYTKLSEILRKQAYFYDKIIRETRPAVTYFRVSFYGRGFPHYLKDQVLVYRGEELETLAGFTIRIRSEFPSAEILYKNTPPDKSIVQGIGQHIQICTVNPLPNEIDITNMDKIDEKIASYYRSNEVNEFVFSRPFHRGEKDPTNEFKTLWLERTVQWTNRKFPNILKWSTIASTRKTELTPIENATEMILSKNKELEKMVNDYASGSKSNVNQLSMILNGVIDANVNGGIANYQNAFLSKEYLQNNPEDKDKVQYLKSLLHGQSRILSQGLNVHEKYVNEALRPFHDKMDLMYSAMKVSIETGQPMENVLARPTTLQIQGSIGRSSPGRNSPRDSPAEARKLTNIGKSVSEDSLSKKEKKSSISASLQSFIRRTSVQVPSESRSSSSTHEKQSPLAGSSSPQMSRNGSDTDVSVSPVLPHDVPNAAMKRLGLSPSLTASAPSLVSIEEEERPLLPPKIQNKRHTSSVDKSIYLPHASMENVSAEPDDIVNNNKGQMNARQSNSSPSIPQSIEDQHLSPFSLIDSRSEFSSGSSLNSDLQSGESARNSRDLTDHIVTPKPPVLKPRTRRQSAEESIPIVPPTLPVRKSRPSSIRNSFTENEPLSEEDVPPPLPTKKLSRKLSQEQS